MRFESEEVGNRQNAVGNNLQVLADQLKNYFTSRDNGDYDDMVQFLGKMRGAVRISIGFPTTRWDIEKFIRFAKKLLNKRVAEDVLTALDCNVDLQTSLNRGNGFPPTCCTLEDALPVMNNL